MKIRIPLPVIVGVVLLLIVSIPYLILGQNAYVLIHDNLDSEFLYLHLLKVNNLLFSLDSNNKIEQVMNGLPVGFIHSQFNFVRILFAAFDSFTAYVLNNIIIRMIGFAGMYLFLSKYIPTTRILNIVVAFIFSLIPLYVLYGATVMGLPFVVWAFLNLKHERNIIVSMVVICLYPFYSHMVMIAPFLLFLLGSYFLFCLIYERKFLKKYFVGLVAMTLLFLLSNINLLKAFVSNASDSSRSTWSPVKTSLLKCVKLSKQAILEGQYHSSSFPVWPILLVAIIALAVDFKNINLRNKLLQLLLIIVTISVFYGFYPLLRYETRDTIHILTAFQFNRFTFLLPILWFIALAYSIKVLYTRSAIVVAVILSIQFGFMLSKNRELHVNFRKLAHMRSDEPSFSEFFGKEMFQKAKEEINEEVKNYRIVSIGMHPSVAQYNGFFTLDSYQNNYPLSYKIQFRETIERELTKNDEMRQYFDEWGSRCYVYSAELYDKCRFNCYKNTGKELENLDIDTQKLSTMGCRYVFSAVKINNYNLLNLEPFAQYEDKSSIWNLFVYKLNPLIK